MPDTTRARKRTPRNHLAHRQAYKCRGCGASVKACGLCRQEARFWVADPAWQKATLYLCETHVLPFQAWRAVQSFGDYKPGSQALGAALEDASPRSFNFDAQAPEIAAYMPGDEGGCCDTWGT